MNSVDFASNRGETGKRTFTFQHSLCVCSDATRV